MTSISDSEAEVQISEEGSVRAHPKMLQQAREATGDLRVPLRPVVPTRFSVKFKCDAIPLEHRGELPVWPEERLLSACG